MLLFLLSTVFIVSIAFIVPIEMMSWFQLLGATQLFLEKVVFPISSFYTEKHLSNEQGRLLVPERKGKKINHKSQHLEVNCYFTGVS